MDESRSTSAFKSKVFEIFVGPSAELFFAHADILSKSKVLRTEVKGLWNEASGEKIVWNDWTVNGAEKFLEWLYTDDYTCPYPVAPIASKEDGEASGINFADVYSSTANVYSSTNDAPVNSDLRITGWGGFCEGTAPKTADGAAVEEVSHVKVIGASKLLALRDLNWLGCHALDKTSQAEEYEKWTGRMQWTPAELNYESTFMTHAEVYVMACHYMVDDLKNMAWQRLRSVLISVGTPQIGSPVVRNLVTLIHYVYQETASQDVNSNEEPLRELIVTFMALHFKQLKGSAIDDLVRSRADIDREFAADLMSTLMHRIESLEAQIPSPASMKSMKSRGKIRRTLPPDVVG
ncbi:MAG: hypothetical protein L6R37_001613 [Teloschistes peruensis]|nr:MAG: hypothetical protein L6R37_001613 [Teloschistes peruensis]